MHICVIASVSHQHCLSTAKKLFFKSFKIQFMIQLSNKHEERKLPHFFSLSNSFVCLKVCSKIDHHLLFNGCPGRGKIGKICKISGEKLVFSPQISYIILRWNAVKLCKITARASGEKTNFSPLILHIFPIFAVNFYMITAYLSGELT